MSDWSTYVDRFDELESKNVDEKTLELVLKLVLTIEKGLNEMIDSCKTWIDGRILAYELEYYTLNVADANVDDNTQSNRQKMAKGKFIIANKQLIMRVVNKKLPPGVRARVEEISNRRNESFYMKTIHIVRIYLEKIRA